MLNSIAPVVLLDACRIDQFTNPPVLNGVPALGALADCLTG